MADTKPEGLTSDDLREMYRLMLMGRRFSERAMELAEAGRLPTGLHPSAGQEAVGVGACYGLRDTDWVLPALRTTEAYWTRGGLAAADDERHHGQRGQHLRRQGVVPPTAATRSWASSPGPP